MSFASKLTGLCLVSRAMLASGFTVQAPAVMSSRYFPMANANRYTVPATMHTSLFSTAVPEPGPCPECQDEATYWDGSTLFICTSCAHEWTIDQAGPALAKTADDGDNDDVVVTRDRNGAILKTSDTCVLIQDLAKGKLKKGTKVKIRVGDYGDGHDCEATIPGVGTYALKSEFLKKV